MAIGRRGDQAGERPAEHTQADDRDPGRERCRGRLAAAQQEGRRGAQLGRAALGLVDRERHVAGHRQHDPPADRAHDLRRPVRIAELAAAHEIRHEEARDHRRQDDPQDVQVHRHDRGGAGDDPPARPAGLPGMPGRREGDRAGQGDQVRVPDEGRFVDGAGRDGHQQARDQSGGRAADRPAEPGRHRDRRDAGERDRERDAGRVGAGDRRRRGQEEVVEDAVVEVADRGRRTEQRHLAPLDEVAQDEHVVALVGVPGAAGREVDEAEERGHRDDPGDAEPERGPLGDAEAFDDPEGSEDAGPRVGGVRLDGCLGDGVRSARAVPGSSAAGCSGDDSTTASLTVARPSPRRRLRPPRPTPSTRAAAIVEARARTPPAATARAHRRARAPGPGPG